MSAIMNKLYNYNPMNSIETTLQEVCEGLISMFTINIVIIYLMTILTNLEGWVQAVARGGLEPSAQQWYLD